GGHADGQGVERREVDCGNPVDLKARVGIAGARFAGAGYGSVTGGSIACRRLPARWARRDDHRVVPFPPQMLQHPQHRIGNPIHDGDEALRDDRNPHCSPCCAFHEFSRHRTSSHRTPLSTIATTSEESAGIQAKVQPRPCTFTLRGSDFWYSTRTRWPASRPIGYSKPRSGWW